MIEKIGLLDNGLDGMVKTAWEIYKNWEQCGQPSNNPLYCTYSLQLFKQTFCRYNVSIEFMGLFDSINSCGIFIDKLFPYTSNTSNVNHIRHAVSIHERRSKFKQNLFRLHSYLPSFLTNNEITRDCQSEISNDNDNDNISLISQIEMPDDDNVTRSHDVSVQFSKRCSRDILEVWFPGDHSDIGGCWPYDDNGNKISKLPLRWILSFALKYGVQFKSNALDEFNLKFTSLNSALTFQHDTLSFKGHKYPSYISPYCMAKNIYDEENQKHDNDNDNDENDINTNLSSNPNETHDRKKKTRTNIKSSLFPDFSKYISKPDLRNEFNKIDTFKGHGDSSFINTLFWWILEIIPIGYRIENKDGKWRPIYWPNLGEKRNVPKNAKVHWSLLWRIKFIKNVDISHLPEVYKNLENLILNDDKEEKMFNDNLSTLSSSSPSDNNQTLILRVEDLVDLKTGILKTDIHELLTSHLNTNTKIKLDIDWDNPPNELINLQ